MFKRKNLWLALPKPIWCLAPMEGVTDSPFRQIIRECSTPSALRASPSNLKGENKEVVFFTEFTSVEGMFSPGRKQVEQRLIFTKAERPLVAQIWGLKPENFFRAGREIVEMGFDGVDVNFGCPDRSVIKMGACSAMMERDRPRVREILQAIKEGVRGNPADSAGRIPVSVKTRIGFKQIDTEEWCGFLLEQKIDALTVHGRTVRELSDVPCHWDEIGKVVRLRDQMHRTSGVHSGSATVIIGNGDVQSLAEAKEKVAEYGVDGVMVGRGILHNPWLFNSCQSAVDSLQRSRQGRLDLLLKHTRLFVETWRETKNFEDIKKYFKIYVRDFADAGEWRSQLMECKNIADVEKVVLRLSHESRG